jgi:tetratricopeptide (TPR) repeat protein
VAAVRGRRRYFVRLGSLVLVAALVGAGTIWYYRTSRPASLLRQGRAALFDGDVGQAERLAAWLDWWGYPDQAHLLRGQIFLLQRQLNPAILEYNQIRQDQGEVLAEASLIYGLEFYALGRPVEAEKFLLHVVNVRPEEVTARRALAAIYYDRGAMGYALAHLKKWSELAPQDGQPHRFMGVIYDSLGADAPVVEHYRAALDRDLTPRMRQELVVGLAEALAKQREYAAALACLDKWPFEAGAVPAGVPELRAECLYGLGRHAEAFRALEPVLASPAPTPRALRVRAQSYLDADEAAAAVPLLEKALRIDSHDCPCRYQLATAYEHLGQRAAAAEQRRLLEASRRAFQELSDLNQEAIRKPEDARVRRSLAEVCWRLNKPDLAQMWLRAADACPGEGP